MNSDQPQLLVQDSACSEPVENTKEQSKLPELQATLAELEAGWLMYRQYSIGRYGGSRHGAPSSSRDRARAIICSGLSGWLLLSTAADWWKTGSLVLLFFAAPFTAVALFSSLVLVPASREFELRRSGYIARREKLLEEIDLEARR